MKLETVPLGAISPDPANVRKHSAKNIDAIKASLRRFGQQKPIVVDAKGIVLAGNGTLAAARDLGWKEIQIVRTELTGTQATAFGIADNRSAELAEWDDKLGEVLASLEAEDFPLAEIGFDEADLAELVGEPEPSDADADPQIDKAEELRAKWGVELGQVWQLGNHRLLCGDSTNRIDVEKLMNGEKADMCFTSPPYALGKSVSLSGNKVMSAKGNAYDNHKDDSHSWMGLMDGWWTASLDYISHAWIINIQPLAGNKRDLMRWINDRVDRLVDIATWDKGHAAPQMAAGVMSSRFEWVIALGRDGASRSIPLSSWQGTVQNVYEGPPQRSNDYSDLHAATMPIHLPLWAIGTLCDRSRLIYEPFCGTGTTIIACEQLARACRAMEISPAYVAVTIQRWADATGKEPRKL
jgi:DNA modification methylase